jgi:hypothetical protein
MDCIVKKSDELPNTPEVVVSIDKNNPDEMVYMTAIIDGRTIFYHEAIWTLNNGLIPDDKLVSHIDGNAMNNATDNLHLVDENKDSGDLHGRFDKVFHKSSYDEDFVKEHFNDVFLVVGNFSKENRFDVIEN